jgi:hypothetical protein
MTTCIPTSQCISNALRSCAFASEFSRQLMQLMLAELMQLFIELN